MPTGHIPRSLTVYVRGDGTRHASPGDQITVTGVFLPVPYSGFRAIRAGLLSDTFLEAHHIHKAKKTYQEQTLTDAMREDIEEKAANSEVGVQPQRAEGYVRGLTCESARCTTCCPRLLPRRSTGTTTSRRRCCCCSWGVSAASCLMA